MATGLVTASRDALKKFELHGIRTRDYFLAIKNANPAAVILSTPANFRARIEQIQRGLEASGAKSRVRYVAAILEGERELFKECCTHLQDCLDVLQATARKHLKRYTRICKARQQYYVSGSYPSPAAISSELASVRGPLQAVIEREYVDIKTGQSGWNVHFDSYYAAIECYRSQIATMNKLIDEENKKSTDRTGIRLRVVAIAVAILLFVAGYLFGRR